MTNGNLPIPGRVQRFRLELGYKASSASYLMNHISNITFTRAGPTGAVSNPASIGGA
jgi:hypothetical protein